MYVPASLSCMQTSCKSKVIMFEKSKYIKALKFQS